MHYLGLKTHIVLICLGFVFGSVSLSAQTDGTDDSTSVSSLISKSSVETPSNTSTEALFSIDEHTELDSSLNNNQNFILLPTNSELNQRKNPASAKGVLLGKTEAIVLDKNQDSPTPIE